MSFTARYFEMNKGKTNIEGDKIYSGGGRVVTPATPTSPPKPSK